MILIRGVPVVTVCCRGRTRTELRSTDPGSHLVNGVRSHPGGILLHFNKRDEPIDGLAPGLPDRDFERFLHLRFRFIELRVQRNEFVVYTDIASSTKHTRR